jgi:hypothetical protein
VSNHLRRTTWLKLKDKIVSKSKIIILPFIFQQKWRSSYSYPPTYFPLDLHFFFFFGSDKKFQFSKIFMLTNFIAIVDLEIIYIDWNGESIIHTI